MKRLDDIHRNAEQGEGPCAKCPAYETHESTLVNPGIGNPDGELLFVSEEPRHIMDWETYDSWRAYNETWMPRFADATGGRMIDRLLARTSLDLGDVFVVDSIQCPTKRDEARGTPDIETEHAFASCRTYLRRTIEIMEPTGIVTLGRQATSRTFRVFGVPTDEATEVRVTRAYGRSKFDTPYPHVISLHWAQRTVAEAEWVPIVQAAIAEIVSEY